MIHPVQIVQIETTPYWVMVKAMPPRNFEWTSGSKVDVAIPEPSLVPQAMFSSWTASDKKEGLLELLVARQDTPLIRHLVTMKQGGMLFLKPSTSSVSFPDSGVWVALQEAASVMRGCAIRFQQTPNQIDLVLVQTKKAYFADITRVAGQNPSFTIHVAETQEQCLATLRQLTDKPMTIMGNETQITWLTRLLQDQGLTLNQASYVTMS